MISTYYSKPIMTLSKGEYNRARKEAEKIKPWDLTWHDNKVLSDGETMQRKLAHNIRVQYVIRNGVVKILDIFKKVWWPR